MNKNRIIIGIVTLIIGLILHFFKVNDRLDFLSGFLVAMGIGLIILGRFRSKKE